MIKKINLKSEFVKYMVVLMSGTVLAQLLSYLFAPIITRLYTPEEAAELGLFLRIVSVGAALATLRYELALPIPKQDVHSFRLYRIAFTLTLFVSAIALLILIIPAGYSTDINAGLFLILLPIGLLFTAIGNIGTNWAIRNKFFSTISYSKITNALFSGGSKVLFGWMNMGYIGLIIGMVIGAVVSSVWFLRDFFKAQSNYSITARSPRNFVLAREYSEFPRINLPHVLMDLGRDLVVAVLILELFAKEDFGLYDHSYRMLQLPLVLVGLAIGQVFFQRCADMMNKGQSITALLMRSLGLLTALSIIPFGIIFLFGEEIFAFVFGEEWRGAGTFSEILAPWFAIKFISSPVSSIPLIVKKQGAFFVLSSVSAVLMIGAIAIPHFLYQADIETTLWILSGTQAVYLIFLIYKMIGFTK